VIVAFELVSPIQHHPQHPIRPGFILRRALFLKHLSGQASARDAVRIGCTSWSEASCVAAGRFLLLFSEAGWQIESNKVFRLEPQVPITGVSITTRSPENEPKDPLPPHLGRWRPMDESHKTIYYAFQSIDIPVGGSTDDSLKNGTLGIYFGSEPTKPPHAPAENQTTTAKVTAVVKPSSVVDWHDKHNWRKYLQTGITRTDVRRIFGDPEKMHVSGILETWEYGSGSITFSVESGTRDGSLYSWDEPN